MGRRGAFLPIALIIPEGPGMMLRFVWGLDKGHSPGGGIIVNSKIREGKWHLLWGTKPDGGMQWADCVWPGIET